MSKCQCQLCEYEARIRELEAERDAAYVTLGRKAEQLEAAEAKLAKIERLKPWRRHRNRFVSDSDGDWLEYSRVRAILRGEDT